MKTGVLGVIPARLGSTRFPGKALHLFRGKPLLYYVWREMSRSRKIDRLVIATDSREIRCEAEDFGAEVVATSSRHKTGSDRAAEVVQKLGGTMVVNIQGDNLGLKAGPVDKAIELLAGSRDLDCTTIIRRITDDSELFNPNVVKVAVGAANRALWFSRFPLPYLQHVEPGVRSAQAGFWAHIGVYVFKRSLLTRFADSRRSAMEQAESLEQLRVLEIGGRIGLVKTRTRSVSVDSPDDLQKLSRILT